MQSFPRKIYRKEKCKTIKIAKKTKTCINFTFWYDRFKLEKRIGAAVVCKLNNKWLIQKVLLQKNKEIFNVELQKIYIVMKIVERKYLKA